MLQVLQQHKFNAKKNLCMFRKFPGMRTILSLWGRQKQKSTVEPFLNEDLHLQKLNLRIHGIIFFFIKLIFSFENDWTKVRLYYGILNVWFCQWPPSLFSCSLALFCILPSLCLFLMKIHIIRRADLGVWLLGFFSSIRRKAFS